MIDKKFKILAINPVNGKHYTEKNAILFCAHDAAVPAMLQFYRDECKSLGSNPEHMESIGLMIDRVEGYQMVVKKKVADTVGDELIECLKP